jgi:hypothetical protein
MGRIRSRRPCRPVARSRQVRAGFPRNDPLGRSGGASRKVPGGPRKRVNQSSAGALLAVERFGFRFGRNRPAVAWMSIDVLAEIGFVVLVGLAAKNAILIVEFARQAQLEGASAGEAAVRAARTRLRPILMTSFAFILGVAPLMVATGAGAEMRQSLGTAVFSGMLGVTGFGLLFTPVFYTVIRRIGSTARAGKKSMTISQGVGWKGRVG